MVKLVSHITDSDIAELGRLWDEHWSKQNRSLPSREDRIIDAIVKNDSGKVICYGQVRPFAELLFFLDPTANKRDKVGALKLLMNEAMMGTEHAGIKTLYAFMSDPDFSLVIQKRYGFQRIIDPGELLVRSL